MPKLIRRIPALLLPFVLMGIFSNVDGAQTCLSESQIPSSTPTTAFTDHGDGTLTHHATGLMWMKCSLGQSGNDCATGSPTVYDWNQALDTAAASSFAGHTDWRLPDVKELRSIVEERCFGPAINSSVFPSTPSYGYWSSSPNASNSNYAWVVNSSGDSNARARGDFHYARLVRGGQ